MAIPISKSAIGLYWIIVADEAMADFYVQESRRGRIDKTFSIANDDAKKKSMDLRSDRGGRRFDQQGSARSVLSGQHSAKDNASLQFGRIVAQRIVQIQNDSKVAGFGVIAAPKFLGTLRKAIEVAGGTSPSFTINKDVVGQDIVVIERLLADSLT